MFETDLILWLQNLDAPGIFRWMRWVTNLGYGWIYTLAFLVLGFGFRLKPLLGVALALVLASTTTDAMKEGFALPRPNAVDAQVLKTGKAGTHLVEDGSAKDFWSLPDPTAIEAERRREEPEYGFPSGHVSMAMAFLLSLALLLPMRGPLAWGMVVSWPLLMAVSRMYLGRHFLADVLAGLAVGAGCAAVAVVAVRAIESGQDSARRAWTVLALLALSLAWLAGSTDLVDPAKIGELVGTLGCLLVLLHFGFPEDKASPIRRLGRVACALCLGFGLGWAMDLAYQAGGWPEGHAMGFVFVALGIPAAILGTVALARGLGLYVPTAPPSHAG